MSKTMISHSKSLSKYLEEIAENNKILDTKQFAFLVKEITSFFRF